MRLLSKKINNKGHVILTCKQARFFGIYKKTVEFIATKEYPKGYWNWRQKDKETPINQITAFELDVLCNRKI